MQNLKLLIGVVVGTLALVFGIAWLFSREEQVEPVSYDSGLIEGDKRHVRSGAREASPSTSSGSATDSGEMKEASESSEPVGEKIVLVEFSDFQCPACAAVEPLVQQILDKNGERIEFVYRHFPIEQIHRNAREAAVFSEFMADRGLFFEFHDLMFERQDEWAEESDPTELFRGYVVELGVDEAVIDGEFDEQAYNDRINGDLNDARALGVNATPTFFVNGVKASTNELPALVENNLLPIIN